MISGVSKGVPIWHTIKTPWEPQPIAWRYDSHGLRKAALRGQVRSNLTHLVREVLVQDPETGRFDLSAREARSATARADEELARLALCGVSHAKVEWHSYTDPDTQAVRTLARVAIIEEPGAELIDLAEVRDAHPNAATSTEEWNEWGVGIWHYRHSGSRYISEYTKGTQYCRGVPRSKPHEAPRLYLADIEPMGWQG